MIRSHENWSLILSRIENAEGYILSSLKIIGTILAIVAFILVWKGYLILGSCLYGILIAVLLFNHWINQPLNVNNDLGGPAGFLPDDDNDYSGDGLWNENEDNISKLRQHDNF